MKSAFLWIAVVSSAAGIGAPRAAMAQLMGASRPSIGVYAGGSLPLGSFKDQADIGYHGGVFGMLPLTSQLSGRIDGSYTSFRNKDNSFTNAAGTFGTSLLIGTLDAQYNLGTVDEMASGGGALPYISAGAGAYRFKFDDTCTGSDCSSTQSRVSITETHWGLNAGAGAIFLLSGFTPFVDVRYHSIVPKGGQTARVSVLFASFGLKF